MVEGSRVGRVCDVVGKNKAATSKENESGEEAEGILVISHAV